MEITRIKFKARYAETDQMGVINHSRYLDWFSEARIEWLRERGYAYREWEEQGLTLPVIRIEVEYRKSVKFDDLVEIKIQCSRITNKQVIFEYELTCCNEIRAKGTTLHYFVENGKVRSLDEKFRVNLVPG